MKISPDTKDSVLFLGGILGIISQGILYTFGVEPSWPLLTIYGGMAGLPVAFEADRRIRGRRERQDEGGD